MRMKDVEKQFIEDCKDYIEEHSGDKIAIGYAYDCYVDALVKDGKLTQRQWQNHENPFYHSNVITKTYLRRK